MIPYLTLRTREHLFESAVRRIFTKKSCGRIDICRFSWYNDILLRVRMHLSLTLTRILSSACRRICHEFR